MNKSMTDDERIDRIVDGLKCSIAEAKDILKYDKLIEAGADPFPQTQEQKAASKKYTTTGTKTKKPTVYKLETREKKQNTAKRHLMETLEGLFQSFDGFEILNPERLLRFNYQGKAYEITLTEKRGKRGG